MWLTAHLGVLSIFLINWTNSAEWRSKRGYFDVRYGQDAYLECEISGTFIGFFNPKNEKINVVAGGRYKISGPTDNIKVLEISKVTEDDYGTYYCKDSTSNSTANLDIGAVFKPVLPQSLAIGYDGKIKAEVRGMPRHAITWYRNGEAVAAIDASGTLTLNDKDRYGIEYFGSLVIKNVQQTDAGKYAILVKFTSAKENKTATIDVGYKPKVTSRPASSYTSTKGLALTLPCSFDHTSVNPTWTFTDRSGIVSTINASEVEQTGYTIKDISDVNEGNYTCMASNKYGDEILNTEISLVITPAQITSSFDDMKVPVDSNLEILCEGVGIPSPNLKIFHGAQEVASGQGSAKLSRSMSQQFAGSYKCIAENGATDSNGNKLDVNKSMSVIMLTPPKIDRESITNPIVSALNYFYTFNCSATGNPVPTVEIYQDGKVLTSVNKVTTGLTVRATYEVKQATESDFGDLECKAQNELGDDVVIVPIKRVVKAPPPKRVWRVGKAGLNYIDLEWDSVTGADKYIVYMNDTEVQESSKVKTTVGKLGQNTLHYFRVASVNIAGVGSWSNSTTIRTSDITPPGKVISLQVHHITASNAEVTWDTPENVADSKENPGLEISYNLTWCPMNNDTQEVYESRCVQPPLTRDTSLILKNLEGGMWYKVTVFGVNQGVKGKPEHKIFSTPKPSEPDTDSSGIGKGMSTGAIAGIIIVIIVVILLVVDVFCCFFNHCGFTHCCFETFCSSKQNKYAPTDTDEKELKKHPDELEENIV